MYTMYHVQYQLYCKKCVKLKENMLLKWKNHLVLIILMQKQIIKTIYGNITNFIITIFMTSKKKKNI